MGETYLDPLEGKDQAMIDEGTAVVICGAETPTPGQTEDLDALAARVGELAAASHVVAAALDADGAALRAALGSASGATSIVCVPAALAATASVKDTLPNRIQAVSFDAPNQQVIYGRELGIDPRFLRVAGDRIEAAERDAGSAMAREDVLLMVIGAGFGDEDADSDLGKVARLLWEGMGFGWAEVGFADNAFPSIADAFAKAARLGYARIVVLPYVLFGGAVVDSIRAQIDAIDAGNIEVLVAGHLGPDRAIADVVLERVEEALRGDNNMNCQMCSYREQVIAGTNHHGHHHHDHDHGHDHGHDHHHGDSD